MSSHGILPLATPTITTALENSLDMCFSALYMHELHRKYHHGEYVDLDNVKEENDDEVEEEDDGNLFNSNQKRPLLKKRISFSKNNEDEGEEEEEDDYGENHNKTLTNLNETKTNRYLNQLKLTHANNNANTTIEM